MIIVIFWGHVNTQDNYSLRPVSLLRLIHKVKWPVIVVYCCLCSRLCVVLLHCLLSTLGNEQAFLRATKHGSIVSCQIHRAHCPNTSPSTRPKCISNLTLHNHLEIASKLAVNVKAALSLSTLRFMLHTSCILLLLAYIACFTWSFLFTL